MARGRATHRDYVRARPAALLPARGSRYGPATPPVGTRGDGHLNTCYYWTMEKVGWNNGKNFTYTHTERLCGHVGGAESYPFVPEPYQLYSGALSQLSGYSSSMDMAYGGYTVWYVSGKARDTFRAKREITLTPRGTKLTRLCPHVPIAALLPARVGQELQISAC